MTSRLFCRYLKLAMHPQPQSWATTPGTTSFLGWSRLTPTKLKPWWTLWRPWDGIMCQHWLPRGTMERVALKPSPRSRGRLVSMYLPVDCLRRWQDAKVWTLPSAVWCLLDISILINVWSRQSSVWRSKIVDGFIVLISSKATLIWAVEIPTSVKVFWIVCFDEGVCRHLRATVNLNKWHTVWLF